MARAVTMVVRIRLVFFPFRILTTIAVVPTRIGIVLVWNTLDPFLGSILIAQVLR